MSLIPKGKNRTSLVILSGAGISQESGVATFRDADGLWEGYDISEVATPEAWQRQPDIVLRFYNQRRIQLKSVLPNEAHLICHQLEDDFDVTIITQNVDDLHERAGSSNIIHLHGELLKKRSSINPQLIEQSELKMKLGDRAPDGSLWRPHIVWFGESVPLLPSAAQICEMANILIIVGTSLQVYPAASLYQYAPSSARIFYVDPSPNLDSISNRVQVIAEKASVGMKIVKDMITSEKNIKDL